MKRVFIIGATSFGRVLESWLEQSPEFGKEWIIGGFLHSGENDFSEFPSDYRIEGDWQDFRFAEGDMVVPGIASGEWKRKIFETLSGKVDFLTFVHPRALVCKFVKLGRGVVIGPYCVVGNNVTMGDGSMLDCGVQVGHDSVIGDFVSIMPSVDLGGFCRVDEGSFLGTKSTVVPHKHIGSDCNISAGSVVMRNVRPGRTMGGNPAVPIDD